MRCPQISNVWEEEIKTFPLKTSLLVRKPMKEMAKGMKIEGVHEWILQKNTVYQQ